MNDKMQDILMEYKRYLQVEKGLSKLSWESYAKEVERYLSGVSSLDDITADYLEEYIKKRSGDGLNATSIAHVITIMRSFHRFLVLDHKKDKDLSQVLSSPKKARHLPDVLSVPDTIALLQGLPQTTPYERRNASMIILMYAAGLRVSELVNLKMDQLRLNTGFIICQGKGKKERMVPVAGMAVERLESYLEKDRKLFLKNKKSPYVYLSSRGTPVTRERFWQILDEASRNSDLGRHVHPHTLRHTFATHLLENDADLRAIQEMLGHENITTTTIYTHVSSAKMMAEYEQFHPRRKEKKS